jgi:hypothetical protein
MLPMNLGRIFIPVANFGLPQNLTFQEIVPLSVHAYNKHGSFSLKRCIQ